MKHKPFTPEELEKIILLPEGIYKFKVIESSDEISKSSGKEMIKLKLLVDDGKNEPRFVFDYLLEALIYKLYHFAKATGLMEQYEKGEITANDCLGKTGTVEISVQAGSDKPTGGTYPAKNIVKDYIIGFIPPEVIDNQKPFIDDIPF